jgi:hypothetical protein
VGGQRGPVFQVGEVLCVHYKIMAAGEGP